MINPIVQTIVKEIKKNEQDYTHLVCNIFNSDEGLLILNAVRGNKFLTSCSIIIDEASSDIEYLRLIRKAIQFKIEDKKMGIESLIAKFSVITEEQEKKLKYHSDSEIYQPK